MSRLTLYPPLQGLRGPKTLKSKLPSTPGCTKPINLDIDKMELLPCLSGYLLDA